MKCTVCNAEISVFEPNCPYCGTSLDAMPPAHASAPTNTQQNNQTYNTSYNQPVQPRPVIIQQPVQVPQPAQGNGNATASLVLGLLSFIFCWFIIFSFPMSIVSISLAGKAKRQMYYGAPGRGKSTAGMIFGIFALILSLLIIAFFAIVFIAEFTYVPTYNSYYYY